MEDYTANSNADRRSTYLAVASDVLIGHLRDMVEAWAPGQSNYRAQFVGKDADDAITDIITGIGEMSRGELAGERMTVAYEERSQEDEHSCFSDNTNADIIANALGVQRVYSGDYGCFRPRHTRPDCFRGRGFGGFVGGRDQPLSLIGQVYPHPL